MSRRDGPLATQFDDLQQQQEADTLGMWVFLVTELLFFGGLFTAYTVYRSTYATAFTHASRHMDLWLGAINTLVLISSSLTMALTVNRIKMNDKKWASVFLILTSLFGTVFLLIKGMEYFHKWKEKLVPGSGFIFEQDLQTGARIFFSFYFVMTGLHALHLIIGIGVCAVMLVLIRKNRFTQDYFAPVEVTGLYWHFVDIIWVFLFPLFYLIDRTR